MGGSGKRSARSLPMVLGMHWQRMRIRECPIVCCPLWPYRPFVGNGEPAVDL